METSFGEILGYIGTFIAGGGLMTLVTMKSKKKKGEVEVIHDTVELVYQPMIKAQKERIGELEEEVKSLRSQLQEERLARQNEMNALNKQILQITTALGIQVVSNIHNSQRNLKAKTSDPEK